VVACGEGDMAVCGGRRGRGHSMWWSLRCGGGHGVVVVVTVLVVVAACDGDVVVAV